MDQQIQVGSRHARLGENLLHPFQHARLDALQFGLQCQQVAAGFPQLMHAARS